MSVVPKKVDFKDRLYIGSSRIGYVHYQNNPTPIHKSFGRCATLYAMLMEFLPYIQQQGADAVVFADMKAYILGTLSGEMLNYLKYISQKREENNLSPEAIFSEIQEHAEPDTALRVLMTGLMQIV